MALIRLIPGELTSRSRVHPDHPPFTREGRRMRHELPGRFSLYAREHFARQPQVKRDVRRDAQHAPAASSPRAARFARRPSFATAAPACQHAKNDSGCWSKYTKSGDALVSSEGAHGRKHWWCSSNPPDTDVAYSLDAAIWIRTSAAQSATGTATVERLSR